MSSAPSSDADDLEGITTLGAEQLPDDDFDVVVGMWRLEELRRRERGEV